MIPISKAQIKAIQRLIKYDQRVKRELVHSITGDPSRTSLSDISHAQANNLIHSLGGIPILYDNWAFFDPKKKSHRQVLSLCIQKGWSKTDEKHGEIADLYRLSEWLKSFRSPVKKKLKEMSPNEVSKVISALSSMTIKEFST